MANDADYVEVGLTCADICTALGRGMNGKRLNELSQSVRDAIAQLTTWVKQAVHGLGQLIDDVFDCRTVAEIQKRVIKRSRRGTVSRLFHAKNDKEVIAAWKSDLNTILHVFNVRSVASAWPSLTVHSQTELLINTHVAVSDIRQDVASTHTIVSNVHQSVTNTNTIVSELQHNVTNTLSDIHRAVVIKQGVTDGQNLSVSITYCICRRNNAHRRLDSDQVSDSSC